MDVLHLTIFASLFMFVVAALTYSLYIIVRRGSGSENPTEPYLCGESVSDFRDSISVGSTNLYWGGTSAALRGVYQVLRDLIHTGVLNDWFFYMAIWFASGVLLSFVVVSMGG